MEELNVKIVKLVDSSNYLPWKFQVKILLKNLTNSELLEKNKTDDGVDQAKWTKADLAAQKIIVTSVSERVLVTLTSCTTSKMMLDRLEALYGQKADQALHRLEQEFYAATFDKEGGIAGHIAKLENLAYEMTALGETVSERMLIGKILNTLPEKYNHFHSAWDSTPTAERTINNLMARLLTEEARLNGQEHTEALAAKYHQKKPRQLEERKCFLCGRPGHFKKDCPKNGEVKSCHNCGKPGHSKKNCRSKESVSKSEELKCYNCGKSGHWKMDCKLLKSRPDQGKSVIARAMITKEMAETACLTLEDEDWYLDSGATKHMTNQRRFFDKFLEFKHPEKIGLADGTGIDAIGIGEVIFCVNRGDHEEGIRLRNVLYVPDLSMNLFSPRMTCQKGYNVLLESQKCSVIDSLTGETVLTGKHRGDFWILNLHVSRRQEEDKAYVTQTLERWHQRLGHQNVRHTEEILKSFEIEYQKSEDFFCEACIMGKQKADPFPETGTITKKPGEIIHSDVCGPMEVQSLGGSKLFVLFKDDYSHFRKIYTIRHKSEVKKKLEEFIPWFKNQTGHKIKVFRTDRGKEDLNEAVKTITDKYGIKHEKTVGYTPQQNGSAEREFQTLMDAVRTLSEAKGMSKGFWAEALNTVVYVLNRTGTSSVKGKTPYELIFNKKPAIQYLKVFGSTVYTHVPKKKRKKLDHKSKKGIFIGYSDEVKGYKVYFPETGKMSFHRNVIFREDSLDKKEEPDIVIKESEDHEEDLVNKNFGKENEAENETIEAEVEETVPAQSLELEEDGKRKLRDRSKIKPPKRLDDYAAMAMISKAEEDEPITIEEATQSKEWKMAMNQELKSIQKHNVWKLVNLPPGKVPLKCKWVFRIKKDSEGNIQRYKARLVTCGYSQKYGIDYNETFSPVAKFDSIRSILSIAAMKKMKLSQFDITTAFLYADLEEDIYMEQPPGYNDGSGRVCKLKKSLYGLKQSPRQWNQRFTNFLAKHKLKATDADNCIFVNPDKNLYLAIYVDDGLIAAQKEDDMKRLINELQKEFEITIGPPTCYLGMEIQRRKDGSIFICQRRYTGEILKKFNMEEAIPVSTPIETDSKGLSNSMNPGAKDISREVPFREAIGSLRYLVTGTRPDLCFAVNQVSQYMEKPKVHHWQAVKRIFKYLKRTINYGILYSSKVGKLQGYSDSDYANCLNTRKSITGYVFLNGSGAITWASRKQPIVTLSSMEAEYVAASSAAQEAVWLKRLFMELTGDDVTIPLYVDNASTRRFIENPEAHQRTKHIDVRYHFIRERQLDGTIKTEAIGTSSQLADIFTKGLPRNKFEKLRQDLGIQIHT